MLTYNAIGKNKRNSVLLIFSFLLIITALGYVFSRVYGNPGILAIAVVFSVVSAFVSYYFSDSITLAMSGAREVDRSSARDLYAVVENLTIAAGLPLPRVYIIEDTAINAFATGRDPKHAVVCVTTGCLSRLSKVELEGVLAHELSHVGNYDIRFMTLVVVLVGIITLLADWFVRISFWGGHKRDNREGGNNQIFAIVGIALALLSPIIATLIQLAVSRQREYLADASGALLTRYPEGLASALEKIAKDQEPLEAANKATAHLYIANPLKNQHDGVGWFAGMFNTHPPVEERIKRLREMNL
ncbi:MAG: M48 family metallopeptidase [Candidatus Doudnabacteria bacterium]|nr:M48 family metallopeptidase [Candidatus Doudnabacteria bacterium]